MSGRLLTTVLVAATLGAASSDLPPLQDNSASGHGSCAATEVIQRNRAQITASAARNGVPAVAIAGVIAAESTLNRNMVDAMQDASLATQLAMHDEAWWESWVATWDRAADRASPARLLGNKWPVSVIASGYVMSFGPAQIQPRTAVHACMKTGAARAICRGTKKALMGALLSDTASIELVGLILRYEADSWASEIKSDVRKDVAFLATLYSSGAEYRIASYSPTGHRPNRMGGWVRMRSEAIRFLLDGKEPLARVTAVDSLCEASGPGT